MSSPGPASPGAARTGATPAWHVLHDGVEFHDLGPDYFTRPDAPTTTRRKDHLIRELQALGYTVQITPAA